MVRDGLAVGGLGNTALLTCGWWPPSAPYDGGGCRTADQHLARAYELIPTLEERPGLGAPPLVAEVLLARGEPHAALDDDHAHPGGAVGRRTHGRPDAGVGRPRRRGPGRPRPGPAGRRRAYDGPRSCSTGSSRLRDGLAGVPFTPMVPDDPALPAFRAVFEAESARCKGNEGLGGALGRGRRAVRPGRPGVGGPAGEDAAGLVPVRRAGRAGPTIAGPLRGGAPVRGPARSAVAAAAAGGGHRAAGPGAPGPPRAPVAQAILERPVREPDRTRAGDPRPPGERAAPTRRSPAPCSSARRR